MWEGYLRPPPGTSSPKGGYCYPAGKWLSSIWVLAKFIALSTGHRFFQWKALSTLWTTRPQWLH